MTDYLLFLYAESPIHAGAADSLELLDLPVQREAATRYPVIWGQSLKGALRQAAAEAWPDNRGRVELLFGSAIRGADEETEPEDAEGSRPGLLNIGDAQLVAMPVATLRRTFAWVTSSIALGRLARRYRAAGLSCPDVPHVAEDRGSATSRWADQADRDVVLGPYVVPLDNTAAQALDDWADRLIEDSVISGAPFKPFTDKLKADLLLIGSAIMPELLRECTEQAVRVQLGEEKTVQNGPFYSEYLPTETILVAALKLRGRADAEDTRDALKDLLDGALLQIGGDETLGKGLAWGRLVMGAAS